MRIFGQVVSPPIARFFRFRLEEARHFPRESFRVIGGRLYIRSWATEKLEALSQRFGTVCEPGKLVGMRVWRPITLLRSRRAKFAGVLSSQPYGRFGNQLLSSAVALVVAEELKAPSVGLRLSLPPIVLKFHDLPDRHIAVSYQNRVVAPTSTGGLWLEANWLLSQASLPNRSSIARGFELLRKATLWEHETNAHHYDLVLHFRGTDQLAQTWRPPPISYYEKVCEHLGPKVALLVTDDPKNRLVTTLVARLTGQGIRVVVQASSVRDDAMALLDGEVLCLGIGTFSSSLAGISGKIRVAYSWNQVDWALFTKFYGKFENRPDVQNLHVGDPSGVYAKFFAQDKDVSPAEVERHMMSFPMERLTVSKIPPAM